jgi:hypothetical protein
MTYLAKAQSVRTQPQPVAPVRMDDELASALVAVPAAVTQPIDWPPPEPAWFAAWMAEDDARRAALMAAGKIRLSLSRKRR